LKGRLHGLLSRCCELLSRAKSALHRQAVEGLKSIGIEFRSASLDGDAHVHPIVLKQKNGRESVVFCTVCGGLDAAGSDELEAHKPMLATIVLPANTPEKPNAREEALAALATPYHLQSIANQTNGLRRGE